MEKVPLPVGGGGLPRERFVPSLENLFSWGFEGRLRCPGDIARMSQTLGGTGSKCLCNISGTNFSKRDFAPPEPEFRAEFWETNFGRLNFGPQFLGRIFWFCFFQWKRPAGEFNLEKFTSQNSPFKIQPRNRAKIFTLDLCKGHLADSLKRLWSPSAPVYREFHAEIGKLQKQQFLLPPLSCTCPRESDMY